MAEKRSAETGREGSEEQRGLQRSGRGFLSRGPFDVFGSSPFSLMRRMQEDMDRMFGGFGLGRAWPSVFGEGEREWWPAIDAFQRGNEFVIRADVPGLSREDLTVEIGEDAITLSGERKHEEEEEREGLYRRERAYGRFSRTIPLPEGAVADSAKANFRDGVLEVTVQAPSQEVRRGRRVEISEESQAKTKSS